MADRVESNTDGKTDLMSLAACWQQRTLNARSAFNGVSFHQVLAPVGFLNKVVTIQE